MGEYADMCCDDEMDEHLGMLDDPEDYDPAVIETEFSRSHHKIVERWEYIYNPKAKKNENELLAECNEDFHGTVGKYLFFSKDRNALIKIGKRILKDKKLSRAKVSNTTKDGVHVLCVYDVSARYKYELKEYETINVYYRYWKSDKQTILEHDRR